MTTGRVTSDVWKDIPGYEGIYAINKDGVVRNKYGKRVGLQLSQRGYYRVNLYKNGTSRHFRVHRLVASAFIQNPNNLPQVDHINGDKTDNRVENLRWATNKQNCNYNNRAKCRTRKIVVISKDGDEKEFSSIREAARSLCVNRTGIMSVLGGNQKTTANGSIVIYADRR